MRVSARLPQYPPSSRVGAFLATHALLASLVGRGHQVEVSTYVPGPIKHSYLIDGVYVHPMVPWPELAKRADLVVSHLGDDQEASTWATHHGVPSVRMVHGDPRPGDDLRDDLAVFNSQALADLVGWPGKQVVVHPPVDPAIHRTTPGDRVTLVNLTEAKGGHLFWELADATPDVEFLGVRGGYGIQVEGSAPNVEVIDATVDMAGDVWSRTRLLLMPSERETWGMVAVEAMASGIPTIAHPTPGLVESLGPAGIFADRDDLPGWVAAVRRLLEPDAWAAAGSLSLARSAELDPTQDAARFAAEVEALAPVPV